MAYALSQELSRRLDETLQQMAINAFGSVKQRVASQLLELATTKDRSDARLSAHLSQQELADAVVLYARSLSRALRDLRAAFIRRHLDGRGRYPRRHPALRRVVGLAVRVCDFSRRRSLLKSLTLGGRRSHPR